MFWFLCPRRFPHYAALAILLGGACGERREDETPIEENPPASEANRPALPAEEDIVPVGGDVRRPRGSASNHPHTRSRRANGARKRWSFWS